MEDVVSSRWIRSAGFLASVAIAWVVFVPYRVPWLGLAFVSLACLGALWLGVTSPHSMTQVIGDVEAEPARALAVAQPVAVTVRNTAP